MGGTGPPGGGLGRPRPRARRLFASKTLAPGSAPGSTESEADNTAKSLEDIMRYVENNNKRVKLK